MRNREQKLTICDYVAYKEPKKAYDLLRDSGYSFEEPKNCADIARSLKEYVAMDKDAALKKIAEIHPDKELIQSIDREVRDADFKGQATNDMFGQEYNNPFHRGKMIFQNASGCGCGGYMGFNASGGGCGCGGNCGRKYNADGDQKKDYVPLIVAVGFFALLYMIIDKK
jgi:hypothetical protein